MPRLLPPTLLCLLLLLAGYPASAEPGMHPAVRLLDQHGAPVTVSGLPVSPLQTCDGCHDTAYIEQTSYHASAGFTNGDTLAANVPARFDPLSYTLTPVDAATVSGGIGNWVRDHGWRHVGGGPAAGLLAELSTRGGTGAAGTYELNCFVCHIEQPANSARIAELEAGRFGWAATATLEHTGLVSRVDGGFAYDTDRIAPDGAVAATDLQLTSPLAENCGLCHGPVYYGSAGYHHDNAPELVNLARTGLIFSPQRPVQSGLNLANKAELTEAWDIHAERLLSCSNCHYTSNNPALAAAVPDESLPHLRFDSRVLSIGDYLKKPDHSLVRGSGSTGQPHDPTAPLRRCTDCHDPAPVHTWLPFTELHLASLDCKACHVPRINSTARMATDWTVLTAPGEPLITYRGATGSPDDPAALITGYEPVLLRRELPDGTRRYGPYNLLATWYWVTGENDELLPLQRLTEALFTGDAYHPEVLAALDTDHDGGLSEVELRLDTPAKVTVVADRLLRLGVRNPRIKGELQPYAIHHGVVGAAAAVRDCSDCHGAGSRLAAGFTLAEYLPAGIEPALTGPAGVETSGMITTTGGGGITLKPDVLEDGVYVAGLHRWPWIDILGLLAFLGVITGVAGHAALRVYHRRRGARA